MLIPDATDQSAVVLVVDDDIGLRTALGDLLRASGFAVQLFASAQDLLSHRMPDGPHCLVLDVLMPGFSGLELQDHLIEQGMGTPIVFITGHGDIPMTVRAMKAGAAEFLTKPFKDTELLEAIKRALARSAARQKEDADLRQVRDRYAALTPRQRQVMRLVTTGMLNKEIAAELGTTEVMIKVHRRNVMAKMGADSLPALVRMADRLALGSPSR